MSLTLVDCEYVKVLAMPLASLSIPTSTHCPYPIVSALTRKKKSFFKAKSQKVIEKMIEKFEYINTKMK